MSYSVDLAGLEKQVEDSATYEEATATLTHYSHVLQSTPKQSPGFLNIEKSRQSLGEWQSVAESIREKFSHVIIIGTGGSSLNPQSFVDTAHATIDIRWLDAIDPDYITQALEGVELSKTCFIVISKSGGTTETFAHSCLCQQLLQQAGITDLSNHFYVITDPHDSPLRRFASQHDIHAIDHDADVGGRFAGLTVVGLLPAMIAGLDGRDILQGAEDTLEDITKIKGSQIIKSSALIYTLYTQGYTQSVLMVYQNALVAFSQWFRQVCAESLGKEHKGLTPITALGTVDQHSQLQLYLDGPQDKVFTLFLRDTKGLGEKLSIDQSLAQAFPELEYLQNKTVGDIHHASGEAIAMALSNQARPTRVFRFNAIDATLVGGLWMHIALETIMVAHLLEINAFDQPAVEEGKRLTRSLLA